ncbi:MAG: hypothetical protein ACO3J3_00625 [Candidatus Nanopelagicales bacterium]
MPKWVIAVGAGALLALLVAAGIWASRAESESGAAAMSLNSSATADPTRPVTPTPTPTPEIILWASDVCAARDGLIASVVEVAGSLEYDPDDPASIGEQFQQQVPGQLNGVDAAASALGTALGGIPVDYVDAAVVIPVLQQRLITLEAAKDEALGHVEAAQGAGNPVSAGVEWLQAAASAKGAYDAALLVKDSVDELVASADGDIREAFATAPGCSGISLG